MSAQNDSRFAPLLPQLFAILLAMVATPLLAADKDTRTPGSGPVTLDTIVADATAGDARAQFALGAMYETGRGVPRDDALCARWWRASAEQGLADAQKNMGSLYFSGRGVPLDFAQSMQWFLKAAEQDHPHAQKYVALGYRQGLGLPKDAAKAQYWEDRAKAHDPANAAVVFRPAYEQPGTAPKSDDEIFALFQKQAEAGNPRAQFYIGVAYTSGVGVAKDPVKAQEWITRAAEQGVNSAQGNLGLLYMLGDGVPADPVAAQQWFLIAAERGSDVGGYLSARHGASLSPAESERARQLAGQWLAKNSGTRSVE